MSNNETENNKTLFFFIDSGSKDLSGRPIPSRLITMCRRDLNLKCAPFFPFEGKVVGGGKSSLRGGDFISELTPTKQRRASLRERGAFCKVSGLK